MYWYKISEGEYSDYMEIILGHKTKYSHESFLELIEQAKEKARIARPDLYVNENHVAATWELERILVKEYGFIVLPILHQYHVKR